jgi:hypothetical protein
MRTRGATGSGTTAETRGLAGRGDEPPGPADTIGDERPRLIFTRCHPALAMQTRVTLTLRMVAGLNLHNKQIRELTGPWGCGSDGRRTSSSARRESECCLAWLGICSRWLLGLALIRSMCQRRRPRRASDLGHQRSYCSGIVSPMPRGKPSPKLAITVDPDVHAQIIAAAAAEGVSVSAWMTAAARRALIVRDGLAAVAEWEAEHGAFTREELQAARQRVGMGQPERRSA